jgi:hypothetical protein
MNTNSSFTASVAPLTRVTSRLASVRVANCKPNTLAAQPTLTMIRQQVINSYATESMVWLALAASGLAVLALSLWG